MLKIILMNVQTLFNQKNKNWIAIFCDDASTDGSTDSYQVIVDLV
jgi:glycosyltransferase involved in cell wall biosynthesis